MHTSTNDQILSIGPWAVLTDPAGLLVPGGRAEAVDHAVRQAARRASAVLLPTLALLLGFIFRAAIAFAA